MNRGNFSIEHQQEAESFPYGTRDLPHLSVDITHDTRMPYGTKHLRVMPDIAHNYGKGGAAPVPTEPTISPFAAAATALQPIRTAIQNGIGDAIYGKEDDPKKQRKGLLGISGTETRC